MNVTVNLTDPQAAALRDFLRAIDTGEVPDLINVDALEALERIVAALPRPIQVGDKVRLPGWLNVGEVFALGRNPTTGHEFALVTSEMSGISGTTHTVLVSSLVRVDGPGEVTA